MTAASIPPSTEAMDQIVRRINSAEAYCLPVSASYTEFLTDKLEDLVQLRVDVVQDSEQQLDETIDSEGRTSHIIRIRVRQSGVRDQVRVDQLKLLVRQLWQRVNNWDSSDGRVRVWETDMNFEEVPTKRNLKEEEVFDASVLMRVEVEPAA